MTRQNHPLSPHKPFTPLGTEENLLFDSEPIVAFRKWIVVPWRRGGEVALYSCTYPIQWPSFKPMRAHCIHRYKGKEVPLSHGSSAPDKNHTCGIYAYKQLEKAEGWNANSSVPHIVGSVKLWGAVIKHDLGYRAEYAYPEGFFVQRIPEKWSGPGADELLYLLQELYLSR